MAQTKIALSLVGALFLGLFGCASKAKPLRQKETISAPSQSAQPPNLQEQIPFLNPVVEAPVVSETSQPPVAKARRFAIWIDGAGYDAIMALGFLQELERQGIMPSKIVGTGFGCWVALAWALENNGNQAEWQTFKWTQWDLLKPEGILGKLSGSGSSLKKVAAQIEKMFPLESFSKTKIPVDCPLVESEAPFRVVSARSMKPSLVLSYQMHIPALGAQESSMVDGDSSLYSGIILGQPTGKELVQFSKDASDGAADESLGWIILRTRSTKSRAGPSTWSELLASRSESQNENMGTLGNQAAWFRHDLSAVTQTDNAELVKPDTRRRYLLGGRKDAERLLKQDSLKNFLSGASPL